LKIDEQCQLDSGCFQIVDALRKMLVSELIDAFQLYDELLLD
jgi:hypothetical protein